MGMYNLEKSIQDFAHATFAYALRANYPVYLSTKNTILEGLRRHVRRRVPAHLRRRVLRRIRGGRTDVRAPLIDDMVASCLKWEGGYVWACKNYDGDVQSDAVAQGYGSLGLMTSVLMTARRQDDGVRSRARNGHPAFSAAPAGQADLDQSDRVDLRLDARPAAPRRAGQHARGGRLRPASRRGRRRHSRGWSDDQRSCPTDRAGSALADR